MTELNNEKITRNLERLYNATNNQENDLSFFKALEDYIKYMFKIPTLKEIFDKQISERDRHYETITNLELKAEKEMRGSLKEIFSIIKNNSIDTKLFERFTTHSVSIDESVVNVMDEFEAFKKGRFSKSGYPSANLQYYLYDFSINLLRLGYEKELKNFHVSNEEYAKYYWRINGDKIFVKNEYGNFIFSRTWPERFEQERLLDKERKLKPWGAFELLLNFHRAYDCVVRDVSFDELLNGGKNLMPFEADNRVDTVFLAEDLKSLVGQADFSIYERSNPNHSPKLNRLVAPVFKTALQTTYNFLMQKIEAEDATEEKTTYTILYLNQNGRLFKDPKKIYEMGQESDRYKIVRFLASNNGYQKTSTISQELGNKDEHTLRTEIGKIKENILKKLGVKSLIDGKKQSGYRINPKYKIKLKKE